MNGIFRSVLVFLSVFTVTGVSGQNYEQVSYLSDIFSSKWELDVHGSPARTQLKSNTFGKEEKMSYGYNGGLDLAYYFNTRSRFKVGLSAGVNYSFYNVLRMLNYNDSLKTVDADNDQLIVYQKGDNLKETQNASFIDVPMLLRFEYILSKHFGVYLHAGGYYSMYVNSKYSTTMNYTAKGYYPKYNVTLYNIDVANSPYFYPTDKPMSDKGTLQLKSNFGALCAFGLKYKLTPNIALKAGVSVFMGMTNVSAYSKSPQLLVDNERRINTLMSRGDNIKANAYCIDFGLTFDFRKRGKVPDKLLKELQKETIAEQVKDSVKKVTPSIAEIKDTAKKTNIIYRILVSGKLADSKTNEPLHGRVVFKESGKISATASSPAATGKFSIILARAMYEYEISSPGYIPVVDKLDLSDVTQPVRLPDLMLNKLEPGPIFQFNNVSFQSGSDVITEQSYSLLDLVARLLSENSTLQIEVGCHTDNQGNETSNRILSQRRANAIVKYLTDKGAGASQLKAKGYGSSVPLTENYTEYGRSQNRRVEFKVLSISN